MISFAGRMRRVLIILPLAALLLLAPGCGLGPAAPALAPLPTPLPTLPVAQGALAEAPDTAVAGALLPTPAITPDALPQASATPSGSTAVPSPTPPAGQRQQMGQTAFTLQDYKTTIEQFSGLLRQEPGLDEVEQTDALYKLGQAYLAEGQWVDAATIINQLLAFTDAPPVDANYYLGQAYAAQEAHAPAIAAYSDFLVDAPELGAYIYPLIGQAQMALGETQEAIASYEAALEAPAYRLKEVANRRLLADAHLAAGDTAQAVAEYDRIHDMAETEATRGQMTYLAGAAELLAGNVEAAFERFQMGMDSYPGAYESYLGLVELVKGEVPVDDFQRGLVDYNAAAYAPGVEAFEAYLATNPETYRADTHRYLALSYEALGDVTQALAQMAQYAELVPEDGLLELAKLQARAGNLDTAVDLYEQVATEYPEAEGAPFAAWWSAALSAQLGETGAAIERFVRLAERYPEHVDAPEALHDAGVLAWDDDDRETAVELWLQAARQYPRTLYGGAALLNLVRRVAPDEAERWAEVQTMAENPASVSYHALRASDIVQGIPPFATETPFIIPEDEEVAQAEAEAWLAAQFELDPALVDSAPGPALAQDSRLLVGRRLLELGMFLEGQRELESLRQAYVGEPLETYQLALLLRDLGLFRNSIAAGVSLLSLAGQHELEVPKAIGRLSYPVYFADFILPLAQQYGFDPRLQFALVRQESLFESVARSGAAAQGLSQVIPDTGAWIAERLAWPDFENDDLYKPYVGLNFGAYYLAQQLEYFDGDVHAALAAYNAGPGNAARWHALAGSDLDSFVDAVDFPETELYIERIYAGYEIYRQLYDAAGRTAD